MDVGNASRRRALTTIVALLLMVGSGLPWTAMAEDGTPEDPVITEPVPTQPTVPETTQPIEPSPDPTDVPPSATTVPTVVVTAETPTTINGITVACDTRGAGLTGQMTTTNPAAASNVALSLVTTDDPAIAVLQSISVPVTPGQTGYTFAATLEPGDFEASTTHKVRVVSSDGSIVSDTVNIALDGSATVCVPPGSVDPSPSATSTATATETSTATTTATATETPTSTTTPPPASVGTVVNTSGANLNCRSAANTTAGIVAKLPAGSSVVVRGASVNGWVPVTCANKEGWVSSQYLRVSTVPTTTPTPTATATATATTTPGSPGVATVVNTGTDNLRCRTAPNTGSSVITMLPAGSKVATRGGASNGWVPVTCGGQAGFVSAAFVSISAGTGSPTPTTTATSTTPSGSPTATSTSTTTPGTGSTAYVTGTGGAGLRCRTSVPSGTVITVLAENAQISVLSQSNGWGKVNCGGQTGWVSLSYVLFAVNPGNGAGALRIDIDLGSQYMIVYQGNNVLSRTYVSTGRRGFDTPTGTYYINRKVRVKDMAGVLGGEAYHVRDVPHVMYFTNRGHAIHGAYWHNNFGYVMSHGCVNLPLGFASWLYSITPIGTKVTIHY